MKDTLKFRFDRTQFYVNEEKRTVVCKLTGILTGFTGDFENELAGSAKNTKVAFADEFAVMEFTAKAKCCPNDTFDEKTGKQIAESRAKMKVYATLQQMASKAAEYYTRQATVAADTQDKYLAILSVEAGRIEKLVD